MSLQNHTVEKKWAFPRKKLQTLKNLVIVTLLKSTTGIDGTNTSARHPSSLYIHYQHGQDAHTLRQPRSKNQPSKPFFGGKTFRVWQYFCRRATWKVSWKATRKPWMFFTETWMFFTQTFILDVFFVVWWILFQIFSPYLLPNSSLILFWIHSMLEDASCISQHLYDDCIFYLLKPKSKWKIDFSDSESLL